MFYSLSKLLIISKIFFVQVRIIVSFYFSLKRYTIVSLFIVFTNLSKRFLRTVFLKWLLIIKVSFIVLFINDILFPLEYFFFCGASSSRVLIHICKNFSMPIPTLIFSVNKREKRFSWNLSFENFL